jgi:hypothetical protein
MEYGIMDEVQKYTIENLKGRVETGPVRFNDDWTGIFIRGDEALHYAMQLSLMLSRKEEQSDVLNTMYVQSLASLLASCIHDANS